jgi:hypothetical protein
MASYLAFKTRTLLETRGGCPWPLPAAAVAEMAAPYPAPGYPIPQAACPFDLAVPSPPFGQADADGGQNAWSISFRSPPGGLPVGSFPPDDSPNAAKTHAKNEPKSQTYV